MRRPNRLQIDPYTAERSVGSEESALAGKKKQTTSTREGTAEIGERLARLRKERGIPQVKLAADLGISQAHLSAYERGLLRLHGEMISRMASLLRVSTDELLGHAAPRADAALHQPELRRLWKQFQQVAKLPERDQRAVLRLVNSLAGRGAA